MHARCPLRGGLQSKVDALPAQELRVREQEGSIEWRRGLGRILVQIRALTLPRGDARIQIPTRG
jgi:hypothetical protein